MSTPSTTDIASGTIAGISSTVTYYELALEDKIFLCVKSGILYIFLLLGIRAHAKVSGIQSRIIILYIFYILLVTCILVYELEYDIIPLLFYARLFAMIGNIW